MKIVILTEGGRKIGFGHISRCLALYEAFQMLKVKAKIIVNGDNSIKKFLKNKNFKILNWLKHQDIANIINNYDSVVIDSYLAGKKLLNKVSQRGVLAVYIDDNKRLNYPGGIVLNGNAYAGELNYPKRNGITYLLGNKYTPLRKIFHGVAKKEIPASIKTIMITLGGSDIGDLTPKILRLLAQNYPGYEKNVIIGMGFKNITQIKKEAGKRTKLFYSPAPEKIKKIMQQSDVAISSGGQTLYELARIGIPAIAISVADNQMNNVKALKNYGVIVYAGRSSDKNILKGVSKGMDLVKSRKIRLRMSNEGIRLLDGNGALRVALAIKEKTLASAGFYNE